MKKELFKSLIALKQSEIPFDVIERDLELPINRKKIITIPGVRRCGKSTMMEIAINHLVKDGVSKERILWLGFDDERLTDLSTDEFDEIISAYMELFPNIPIKDVYMFFDEIQLVKNWEYFVLRLYKSYCKNIFVCGSNATMLSTELASVLRGYPLEFPTTTLSFKEFCRFSGISTTDVLEQDKARLRMAFKEYNSSSSFPEIVLTKNKSEQLKLLQGYFNTMILKDLVEHYNTKNIEVVKYFTKRILANLSKPTSINAIYNDIKSQGLKSKPLFHYVAKAHGMAADKAENLLPEIENLKPTLLIIPDASADEPTCRQLKAIGCDVIILDHHTYDFNSNPYAIVVNCLQQDGNHNASGTLVTQKFVDRYCELYDLPPVDNADLVASSIASDVMSLISMENRAYLNLGMEVAEGK